MVEILNETIIRVSSELNEWMDCIFIIDKKHGEDAKKALEKAWDEYFDIEDDCCYGSYLEKALENVGIPYEVYYKDLEDE